MGRTGKSQEGGSPVGEPRPEEKAEQRDMELVVSSQSMQIKKQSLQIEQQSSQIAELVSLIKSLSQRETEEEAKAAPSGSKTHLYIAAGGTPLPTLSEMLKGFTTVLCWSGL
ncbi:hypothetical protein CYMTET_11437 [Cymbomonas tetramitiformis]|uniref:Uncharacterized protein n=1 Tax=Cymbomonas tetramitiformis TaxID=36881 RepID=A0AAE0LCV0_9CHLO|nr:hypothetical protein CYMTET_11437 [Cymbomonas tetramitiformis]